MPNDCFVCDAGYIEISPGSTPPPESEFFGRLQSINSFQSGRVCSASFTEAVWPDKNRKSQFLGKIEAALCRYGLLNDSPDLEPGFVFEACREGRSDAAELLHKYRAYYDRMKALCD